MCLQSSLPDRELYSYLRAKFFLNWKELTAYKTLQKNLSEYTVLTHNFKINAKLITYMQASCKYILTL